MIESVSLSYIPLCRVYTCMVSIFFYIFKVLKRETSFDEWEKKEIMVSGGPQIIFRFLPLNDKMILLVLERVLL